MFKIPKNGNMTSGLIVDWTEDKTSVHDKQIVIKKLPENTDFDSLFDKLEKSKDFYNGVRITIFSINGDNSLIYKAFRGWYDFYNGEKSLRWYSKDELMEIIRDLENEYDFLCLSDSDYNELINQEKLKVKRINDLRKYCSKLKSNFNKFGIDFEDYDYDEYVDYCGNDEEYCGFETTILEDKSIIKVILDGNNIDWKSTDDFFDYYEPIKSSYNKLYNTLKSFINEKFTLSTYEKHGLLLKIYL